MTKKLFILFLVAILCLLLCGCKNIKHGEELSENSRFVLIDRVYWFSRDSHIYGGHTEYTFYDRYTKVIYIANGWGFSPLYDSDGKVMLYTGDNDSYAEWN